MTWTLHVEDFAFEATSSIFSLPSTVSWPFASNCLMTRLKVFNCWIHSPVGCVKKFPDLRFTPLAITSHRETKYWLRLRPSNWSLTKGSKNWWAWVNWWKLRGLSNAPVLIWKCSVRWGIARVLKTTPDICQALPQASRPVL